MLTHALAAAELEDFRSRGYVGPFEALEPSEMAELRRLIVERVLATPSRHSLRHRARHLDSRTVFALASAPAIVGRMASLYGGDLMLWATHFFDKPPARPGRPEEAPWHQDWYTWDLEPMVTVSAWLAITDATPENGGLEVVAGSHKRPIPFQSTTDTRYSLTFGGKRADPALVREADTVKLSMKAGQFILFNERLLHRSGANHTPERRIGLGIRVTLPFVKVYDRVPCVMVSGRDVFGFNRLAGPPTGEPDESEWWTELPEGATVTFDKPVPGFGW